MCFVGMGRMLSRDEQVAEALPDFLRYALRKSEVPVFHPLDYGFADAGLPEDLRDVIQRPSRQRAQDVVVAAVLITQMNERGSRWRNRVADFVEQPE